MAIRAVIIWPELSGYMAACWRALAALDQIELLVIAPPAAKPGVFSRFGPELMAGIPSRVIPTEEYIRGDTLADLAAAHRPDVVVLPGWAHAPIVALASDAKLANAKFAMTMDTPYRGQLRQRLARFRLASYSKRMDRVIVPGERSWYYANSVLRIPEFKIRRGMYGIDFERFAGLWETRVARGEGWPRRFLYIGRYEHDKGIDVLLEGYRAYRASTSDPWPLTCCGGGPYAETIRNEPGISDRGFVQPAEVPAVLQEHGAFVLASRYDPWPLVIVEACAAGLPVIHSEACGSAVELVRPYFNGLGIATANSEALSAAMCWCHENHAALREMGRRAVQMAAPYSAQAWAKRWMRLFEEMTGATRQDSDPAGQRGSLISERF
jgi:glycosyltransferase involved in cell wall biosynthesis